MLDTPGDAYIFPSYQRRIHTAAPAAPCPPTSLLTGLRCRGRSQAKPTSRQLPELDLIGDVPKETPGHARRCLPKLPVGHPHSAHLIAKGRPYHPQTGRQKPEISSEGRPLRCSSRWRAPGTPPGTCAGHVQSPGLSNGVGASESVSPFTVAPIQCPLLTGPALPWTQGGSWGP